MKKENKKTEPIIEKIDWKKQSDKNKLFKSVVKDLHELGAEISELAENISKKKQVA